MNVPVYAPATCWAAEAVVGPQVGCRPWRLIELHPVDLPAVRRASPAEQEGQGDRSADLEYLTRLDVEVAGLFADSPPC